MSAHALNIHTRSSGAGVYWCFSEMGWFKRSWDLNLARPSCSCGLRSRSDLDLWCEAILSGLQGLDLSFSRFPWSSVLWARTAWGLMLLGWPPCPRLLTNEGFCDLICVHFKFDCLFKDQCCVVLHEGCFGCFLSDVFLLSHCVQKYGDQRDFIDRAPGNGDLLSSKAQNKLEAACKFNQC